MPADELTPVGEVTLANGERGTLHRFGAVTLCWSGSMSSSSNRIYQFKPFMLFQGEDGACYFNWDQVPANYRIGQGTTRFDRTGELLR